MLRNDIAAGMPVVPGSKPVKIDPEQAAEWIRLNAPGARPGPGRPKKLPDFAKSQSPEQETGSCTAPPDSESGSKTSTKVNRAPRDVEGGEQVTAERTHAELKRELAKLELKEAERQSRIRDGQLLEVAEVDAEWSAWMIQLSQLLDALPGKLATAALLALKLDTAQRPELERAMNDQILKLRADLEPGKQPNGEEAS